MLGEKMSRPNNARQWIGKEKKCTYLFPASCSALLQKCFATLQNNVLPRLSVTRVIARESIGRISCGEGKTMICGLPWQESCDQLRQTCWNSTWRLRLGAKGLSKSSDLDLDSDDWE